MPHRAGLLLSARERPCGAAAQGSEINLPLVEATLAEELKAAGYVTALVGKWYMGFEGWKYTPTYRGFDRFYGYYSGSIGYVTKQKGRDDPVDLHDDEAIVTDEAELATHLTILLQQKTNATLEEHAAVHPAEPLFLYCARRAEAWTLDSQARLMPPLTLARAR